LLACEADLDVIRYDALARLSLDGGERVEV
jgi:hypothetical protein